MAGLIPNDYETASEAIDHGKPLTIMASRTTHRHSGICEGADHLIAEKISVNGTGAGKEQSKESLVLRPMSVDPGA